MENREKNSLTSLTDEQYNEALFLDSLAKIDPMLWRIKIKLAQLNINPEIIPPVIEAIYQIHAGSGWGKVEIEIRDHKAIKCRGIDDRLLELDLTF